MKKNPWLTKNIQRKKKILIRTIQKTPVLGIYALVGIILSKALRSQGRWLLIMDRPKGLKPSTIGCSNLQPGDWSWYVKKFKKECLK